MISAISAQLLVDVRRPLVRRRRDLVVELAPELGERLVVLGDGAADVHPTILAPTSRNCADRFSKGAKRSPMTRTSSIDNERPSA